MVSDSAFRLHAQNPKDRVGRFFCAIWLLQMRQIYLQSIAMSKSVTSAEIVILARQLRAVFRHGSGIHRKQLLAAMGLNQPILSSLIRSLTHPHHTTPVRSLSDLQTADVHHLTRLFAIGMDGSQMQVIIDLNRAAAREAALRLVGVESEENMTPNSAANALGISRTHLRHLMDNGIIAFSRVGTHHRIAPSEVTRLQAEWQRRSQAMAEAEVASADIDT